MNAQQKSPRKISGFLITIFTGVLVIIVFSTGFIIGVVFFKYSLSLNNLRFLNWKTLSLENEIIQPDLQTERFVTPNGRYIEPQGSRSIESYCKCNQAYLCEDFASPRDAEMCFIQCGGDEGFNFSGLDHDGDLFVCETQ